ncbi:transcription factor Ken-like isoform X6 [Argopecten irradians]|uniref:transcription factor Ken-like isoform X6 n=1 Tax=Argopecten irradians TaxID=31199 RepID=UPI003713FD44
MKMRSLDGKESTFCDILHNAVLQVCREKYWADSPDWEVDGVICISVPHSQEQHVVKIHQKFPSDSNKHFDDRCYECDRKPKDSLSTNETSDRHFSTSVEEEDSSYRNVSVIDLEHASAQPNPTETCGRGTISPNLTSPVREHDQNSQKNFYASPDLSGFGPNVHRQRSEQLKNSNSQSHSKTNNRSKDQEHSSSFTSHSRETTPPRKKAKQAPEEYIVVKAEPDDDEDFALHMECIDEKISENSTDIKDESTQRDLAAETQEDINFLLNVDGSSASHQYNSGDRSWPQRLPTSTVTSQMDTSLSSMAGQGTQGFSNLNLLTHGVDVEDGTMRLTTRVQHPHIIAGQTDSNTPEQRSIPRPSGQDSAAASNTIDSTSLLRDLATKSGARKPVPMFKSLQPSQAQRGRPVQFPWIPKADIKKKYKCEVCGKQFAQQQHYLGHTNVHFGRRPFKCKICSVGFPYQSQLAAHRKSCKEPGESSPSPNRSTCQICSKSFNEHFKLVRHMVQVHHGQNLMASKEFVCTCGAKFDWHAAKKSHCMSCPKASRKDKA